MISLILVGMIQISLLGIQDESIVRLERMYVFGPVSRTLFHDDSIVDERKELCQKGLQMLENIMETQSLNEGNFIEMCNIFKELHK